MNLAENISKESNDLVKVFMGGELIGTVQPLVLGNERVANGVYFTRIRAPIYELGNASAIGDEQ